MFTTFLLSLKQAGLPVSVTEYLSLMAAMKAGVAAYSVDDFYHLSRASLVKDERHIDRFDRVFATCFKGLESADGLEARELPAEWLRKMAERLLTPEEMAQIKALGGFEALMDRLRAVAGGTEGPPSGRFEVDRDGRDISFRRVWLQPRGCAHWPERSRGTGVP